MGACERVCVHAYVLPMCVCVRHKTSVCAHLRASLLFHYRPSSCRRENKLFSYTNTYLTSHYLHINTISLHNTSIASITTPIYSTILQLLFHNRFTIFLCTYFLRKPQSFRVIEYKVSPPSIPVRPR